MPQLNDINLGALRGEDPQKQLETLVSHLNEWGRLITNENLTRVVKSDSGIEALTIGRLQNGLNGILIKDEDNIPRAIFGQLPDGTIGYVISKEGEDVFDIFT